MHCLVDVARCRDSGFEILAPLSTKTSTAAYCPAYRIGGGASGFDKTLKLARELGSKNAGCRTCTGSKVDKGFRALFVGRVSDSDTWYEDSPIPFQVSQVLEAGSKCPAGFLQAQSPCRDAPAVKTRIAVQGDKCSDSLKSAVKDVFIEETGALSVQSTCSGNSNLDLVVEATYENDSTAAEALVTTRSKQFQSALEKALIFVPGQIKLKLDRIEADSLPLTKPSFNIKSLASGQKECFSENNCMEWRIIDGKEIEITMTSCV